MSSDPSTPALRAYAQGERPEVHRGVEALEALRSDWSALCDRCPWTTPFQRPEWLIPWARHFAGEPPRALALRSGGDLAGLLLALDYGDSKDRRCTLLGTGISDCTDVLLDPERAADGATPLFEALFTTSGGFASLSLEQLRPDSPLVDAKAPAGWSEQVLPDESWFAVPLTRGLETLPRKLRVDLGNARRRAERMGKPRIERADGVRIRTLMDGLFRLHALRWKARGSEGQLSNERLQSFHHEVAVEMGRSGRLRLYGLWMDERLASVLYAFQERTRLFLYLDGFDPSFSRIGPGTQLVAHAAERGWAEGARTLDFLRGDEPYKRAWGATELPAVRRVFAKATLE